MQDGGTQADEVVGQPGGQVGDRPTFLELVEQPLRINLNVEGILQPVFDVVDVAGSVVGELADLVGQHRADSPQEQPQRGQQGEEHEPGAQASANSHPLHPVHGGFQREGGEERHQHNHDERLQLFDQPPEHVQPTESRRTGQDGPKQPRRDFLGRCLLGRSFVHVFTLTVAFRPIGDLAYPQAAAILSVSCRLRSALFVSNDVRLGLQGAITLLGEPDGTTEARSAGKSHMMGLHPCGAFA